MRGRLLGFGLLFLAVVSGCISTSSEPEIVATRVVNSNTPTPALASLETPSQQTSPTTISTEIPREIPEQFNIIGIIRNATSNTVVTESLVVNAVFLTQDGTQTIELFNDTLTSNPDGTFNFENIDINSGLVNVRVDYAGIRQFSNFYLLPADLDDTGTLNIDLVVYEVTPNRDALVFNTIETFFDASPTENAATVLHTIEIINQGNQIVYDGQYSFSIPLPTNALNPRIQVPPIIGLLPEDIAVLDTSEDGPIFQGVVPLLPGPSGRLFFSIIYELSYQDEVTVAQRFEYPVARMVFWVPLERELVVESPQLPTASDQLREDINYLGYTVTESIQAEDIFTYSVSGGIVLASDSQLPTPNGQSNTPPIITQDESSNISTIVIGVGVLLILAGVMYLLYDLQKTRITMQTKASVTDAQTNKDKLIEAIAALDTAFESGEISEADYQQQRQSLKQQLRQFFE